MQSFLLSSFVIFPILHISANIYHASYTGICSQSVITYVHMFQYHVPILSIPYILLLDPSFFVRYSFHYQNMILPYIHLLYFIQDPFEGTLSFIVIFQLNDPAPNYPHLVSLLVPFLSLCHDTNVKMVYLERFNISSYCMQLLYVDVLTEESKQTINNSKTPPTSPANYLRFWQVLSDKKTDRHIAKST